MSIRELSISSRGGTTRTKRFVWPPLRAGMRLLAVGVVFALLATSLCGQIATRELEFQTVRFDAVHDGSVTLAWTEIFPATSSGDQSYVVRESDGSVYYRGAFPQAFISGLADGEYSFSVCAIDEQGETIAAAVTVTHWPLFYAATLLTIGGVVFFSVIGVVVHGAWTSRSADQGPEPKGATPRS